jgi:hypothetical protein
MSPPASTAINLPLYFSSLVPVTEKSMRGMDQKLGYPGKDRFVLFYFEPRAEEVIWRDSRAYGFSNGAWSVFEDELAPVAEGYHVNVGSDHTPASHVLLIDRKDRKSYFAKTAEAVLFLVKIVNGELPDAVGPEGGSNGNPASQRATETDYEAIARLAYDIWEKSGRSEGRRLRDWLEAESQLTKRSRKHRRE